MKTTVSIPDEVFAQAKRLARLMKKSRSQLYSDAVREYVARHAGNEVTAALDRVYAKVEADSDFIAAAARRVLEKNPFS